jgi:Tfp pilus assembly pilus retraction ATPase PilT
MQTMNSELIRLYQRRLITKTDALGRSPDPESMLKIIDSNQSFRS